MKLDFVEVEGFRGFRQRARFDIPLGFLIIAGRNGVGKSTVLDAVDFALTGSINKYDVEKAKGGGLNEHIWWVGDGRAEQHYVTVGFIDEQGERFEVTRVRDKHEADGLARILPMLHDADAAGGHPPNALALMETTLIRDEVISASSLDMPGQERFNTVKAAIGAIVGPDYTDRTGKILSEAKARLAEDQARFKLQQTDLGRLLAQLTEARTEASQSADIAEALRLVSEAFPGSTDRPSAEEVRGLVADRRAALERFNRGRIESAALSTARLGIRSERFARLNTQAEDAVRRATEALAASRANLEAANGLLEAEKQTNAVGAHFAALLDHGATLGLQDGHCPLCNAVRKDSEFKAALDSIRLRLAGQAERLAIANRAVEREQGQVNAAQSTLQAQTERLAGLREQTTNLEKAEGALRQTYDQAGFTDVPVDDAASAEARANVEQQRLVSLERAALILGASTAAERVSNLEGQISRLREQIDRTASVISDGESASELARQIDSAARSLSNEILVEQFETVLPLLKEMYRRLRPHTDWTEIDTDFGGKVRGTLNFSVGDGRNPQFLFSSGQRRAAGLAFLLSVHLSRPWCRLRTLLLDDPVQHVDDYRALNLVEVLAAIRRSGRQVIVAVEDAALADLLCRRLRSEVLEPGRRYDLGHGADGSAKVDATLDVLPMPQGVLKIAIAS
ncbi:MAG: AAA family ATPase [Devosia sp.]